jgi:hypothetical protein
LEPGPQASANLPDEAPALFLYLNQINGGRFCRSHIFSKIILIDAMKEKKVVKLFRNKVEKDRKGGY